MIAASQLKPHFFPCVELPRDQQDGCPDDARTTCSRRIGCQRSQMRLTGGTERNPTIRDAISGAAVDGGSEHVDQA